ncbi:MAG: cobalt-precorrin-5B (C(1))-methyltransferase CbiD [Methanobacteriaceae archaeon]
MKYNKNNTINDINSDTKNIHNTNSNSTTNNTIHNSNNNNNNNTPNTNEYGISTGTAATSATLAALELITLNYNSPHNIYNSKNISYVEVISPFNKLNIKVNDINLIKDNIAVASIIKYPYGDIDVTVNTEIQATVTVNDIATNKSNKNNKTSETSKTSKNTNNNNNNNNGNSNNVNNSNNTDNHNSKPYNNKIIIKGGKGIGTVTKPGLQVPVGEAAINPVPKSMIRNNINNYLKSQGINGLEVTVELSVPNGEEIAKKTMNKKLGIMGGISILGTTGIAKPMSKKAYRDSLACQIDIAIGQGYEKFVFVPGNIGEKIALNLFDIEEDQVIKMSNFIGFMLNSAKEKGIDRLVLLGHIGKLIKLAGGIYNTHSSVADCRCEIMASYTALCGAKKNTISKLFKSSTTEDMLNIIKKEEGKEILNSIIKSLASSIKKNCENKFEIEIELYITDMEGNILNKIK